MHIAKRRIILGSSSPDRQAILRTAEVPFEIMAADIDEKAIRFDDPAKLTRELAYAKAEAIVARLSKDDDALLITSDQVIFYDGKIREKPTGAEEARAWLSEYGMSDREIEAVTTVVLSVIEDGALAMDDFITDIARVRMDPLDREVVEQLIRTGKVLSVAGALTIEDPLFWHYVRGMRNGHEDPIDAKTSVMGLPLMQTVQLLKEYDAF